VRNRSDLGAVVNRVRNCLAMLTRFDLHYYYDRWEWEEVEKVQTVRTRAIVLMATVWSQYAETPAWLRARAQSDEEAAVRQAAVQELARGWHDDPQTLAWLQGRAQSDEEAAVRQAAVRELARGWHDDPAVQEFIRILAEGVRRAEKV